MCTFGFKYVNMKIIEIAQYLETISPLALQEDYDNCGFLTGDPGWEFDKALLCLDLNEEVMNEAIRQKCNLVISHHPFIFKGIKKLTPGRPETTIITLAIMNSIAVYAIHTNLDNTLNGLNALVFQSSAFHVMKFSVRVRECYQNWLLSVRLITLPGSGTPCLQLVPEL